MAIRDLASASILIVDDEGANVELLESFLAEDGYENLASTRDPRQVIALFEAVQPDIVLLDLHMPYIDGFAVMRQLAGAVAVDDFVPIVVLTADITPEARQRALSEGAKDFLNKPLDGVEVLLRIRNLLETRFLYLEQRAARDRAEAGEMRASFLAEASRVLGSSFDSRTTLSMLARRTVPAIGDFCMIDLADGEGGFARAGLAHVDPRMQPVLDGLESWSAGRVELEPGHPLAGLARAGKPLLVPEVGSGLAGVAAAGVRDVWSVLMPHSLLSVPFISYAGRTLGALTLATSSSRRRYGADDLALAEEVARRAAFAIENALLYHEAQRATRARDELLAVVAHDLRNPLNTINMVASLLIDSAPDGPQRGHLEMVSRSAQRMNTLIQDLLEVAKLESGKLRMELLPQELGPLLTEAATMLAPLAAARSIDLQVETADALPRVRIDGARILQVISNLVGNAIKFTPEHGSIRVRAERVGGAVRLAISDTGPGIAPEQIPHIFRRFWQASDADHRGIGLGLSIARGIVEAHGGTIWAESRLGEGTTFYFTVPEGEGEVQAVARVTASVSE